MVTVSSFPTSFILFLGCKCRTFSCIKNFVANQHFARAVGFPWHKASLPPPPHGSTARHGTKRGGTRIFPPPPPLTLLHTRHHT